MKTYKMNIWHKIAAYSCYFFLGIILVLLFPMNVKAEPDYGKEIIMVSMGDSYSSGEGIPPFYGPKTLEKQVKDEDWLAHRSIKSWSGQLELSGLDKCMKEYKVDLKKKEDSDGNTGKWYFVASSGAITTNIFQEGQNKPYCRTIDARGTLLSKDNPLPKQAEIFDSITKDEVDYITLTLGGNDVGFSDIVKSCAMNVPYTERNGLPNLLSTAWENFNEGDDSISEKLYNVYKELWEKNGKKGNIIVAGYPQLLDPTGGKVLFKYGFDETDTALINKNVSDFNDAIEQVVLKTQKEEHANIYFVSVEDSFIDHGAYADEPYINGVVYPSTTEDLEDDFTSAYSIHPNEKGAAAYAACVQEMIDWIEAGKPSITVSGQVIDKNDQPVGDLTVVIETEKAKKEVFRGTTDENGEFSGDIKLTTQKLHIVVSNEEGLLIDTSVTKPIEYGNNDLGKIKLNYYEETMVVEIDDQASIDKDAINALYEQTIADYDKMMHEGQLSYREKNRDTYEDADRYTYYTIVDIDGNGVEELILRFDRQDASHLTNQNSGYGESTYIYTIHDGIVKEVMLPEYEPESPIRGFVPDNWHIGFTHIFKGSNLISRGTHSMLQYDNFYSYKDGALSESPVLEITRGDDTWLINNEKKTPEECIEAYNTAANNDEGYELQLYERETVGNSTEDNNKSSLIEEYIQFIKAKNDGRDFQNYIIYDIDKDGYPELLILVGIPEERRSVYEIYSYKSGRFEFQTQCKNCLPHGPAAYASYPDGNGMIAHFSFKGAEGVFLLSLSGHEIVDEPLYSEKLENHPTQYYLDEYDQYYQDSYNHNNYINHQFYVGENASPYYDGSYLLGQSAMDDFTAVYEAFGAEENQTVELEDNGAEVIDLYEYRKTDVWELAEMIGGMSQGDGEGIILGSSSPNITIAAFVDTVYGTGTNYIGLFERCDYTIGGIMVGDSVASTDEKILALGFDLYEDGMQAYGNPWKEYRKGMESLSYHWDTDNSLIEDIVWGEYHD